MTKIKDVATAKVGLSGMFGTASTPEGLSPLEDRPLTTKEEVEGTLTDETKEALLESVKRRQYLKSGRPPGSKGRKAPETIPMTFRITPEKQDRLREVALKRGLFISEVLDQAIDLVLEKYEKEGL
jgi:hypothetical protein